MKQHTRIRKFYTACLILGALIPCKPNLTYAGADGAQGVVRVYRRKIVVQNFRPGGSNELPQLQPGEKQVICITVVKSTPTEEELLRQNEQRKVLRQLAINNQLAFCVAKSAITATALTAGCLLLSAGSFGVASTFCLTDVGFIGTMMLCQCTVAKNNADAALALWKLQADNKAKALWNDQQKEQAESQAIAQLDAVDPCP